MQMRTGLDVDANGLSARRGEVGHVAVGRLDHQVDVERQVRASADGFYDAWTNADVGDKVTVHHIDVDPVSAGGLGGANFFTQPGKIRGKDRGRDS
jgi:hypothetical protein